ncbi:pentapeptide repeat-containing protein [Catenuloplanes sp. NPDC051500]|uniref:pentapeptide repeat-containing protein n=1 Tax=Catenuloplanes sp. NPDC051500 TaxID=3363959 RepID=UPI0037B72315
MKSGGEDEPRVVPYGIDPRDLDPVTEPPLEDLSDAFVSNVDWAGLELAGIRLTRCYLTDVELLEADWRNVRLTECVLERVDLSSAYLRGLTMDRCELIGCRLTGAQLFDGTLTDVTFEDCRLDFAVWEEVQATGPVSWVGCTLDKASLTRCRLTKAAFSDCRMKDLELADCDLEGADLRGNDLTGINGVPSLYGARIGRDQLADITALAVRDLNLTVEAEAVSW